MRESSGVDAPFVIKTTPQSSFVPSPWARIGNAPPSFGMIALQVKALRHAELEKLPLIGSHRFPIHREDLGLQRAGVDVKIRGGGRGNHPEQNGLLSIQRGSFQGHQACDGLQAGHRI